MIRREFSMAVRARALFRAKFCCEICDKRGTLELHHIGNPSDASLFNCQVLCPECHLEEHVRRKK